MGIASRAEDFCTGHRQTVIDFRALRMIGVRHESPDSRNPRQRCKRSQRKGRKKKITSVHMASMILRIASSTKLRNRSVDWIYHSSVRRLLHQKLPTFPDIA